MLIFPFTFQTWNDIKTRTKKKKADNKKEANKTGGGQNIAETMDAVDDKVLDLIGMIISGFHLYWLFLSETLLWIYVIFLLILLF